MRPIRANGKRGHYYPTIRPLIKNPLPATGTECSRQHSHMDRNPYVGHSVFMTSIARLTIQLLDPGAALLPLPSLLLFEVVDQIHPPAR